jgi:hypothetical protein
MAAMSDFLENAILNATLNATTYTSPAAVYIGLFTSDPTDAGSGTEVSGGSYARKAGTFTTASGTGGSVSTNAAVEFDQATASWGTITHFGLFDAISTGNLLYHGAFTASKAIDTGDILKVASGDITVTLA